VAARTFLGTVRLALLLAVLVFVALGAWLDRRRSTDWDDTLRVTVYPVPAVTTGAGASCNASVDAVDFDNAASFLAQEAAAYGVSLEEPVRFRVSHAAHGPPPALPTDPGPLSIALWSLRLRYWAWRVAADDPLANPDVQVFAVYQEGDGRRAAPVAVPRVLLVDSDGRAASRVVEALADAGLEVRHSPTVALADEMIENWPPQVVVISGRHDVGGAGGRLRALRLPVVLLTDADEDAVGTWGPRVVRLQSSPGPEAILSALRDLGIVTNS